MGSAKDFWERLSPARHRTAAAQNEIYRGQAESRWPLVPIVLRKEHRRRFPPIHDTATVQLVHELGLLKSFCEFCDQTGVRIPGDSIEFRATVLELNAYKNIAHDVQSWPSAQVLEVMALAQHHGVPTRLLDWSRHAYSAVYFAAVSALRRRELWSPGDRLAIWILNLDKINVYRKRVRVVAPPGSVSPHLAAQSGLFTVHAQGGNPEEPLNVTGLEDEFLIPGDTPLTKLCVPVVQSVPLYEYCRKVGVSGATLFPGATGAAAAVLDDLHYHGVRQWLLENPTFCT